MQTTRPRESFPHRLARDMRAHYVAYLLAVPMLAYFLVFKYWPMYGVVMAFQDYTPGKGFLYSPFVGLKHFISFFNAYNCWDIVRNTFLLSLYELLWSFPAPIILALLINEVRNRAFRRTIQTVTYMPYFVSLVVICGLITEFTKTDGLISALVGAFTGDSSNLLTKSGAFRTIYIASGVWQGCGWNSIIYIAALSGIDPQLYEAANLDGAGAFRKIWHVTLPGILPTIMVLLIMRIGSMLNVGYEKILLLYNSLNAETAEIISTYVYKRGLIDARYSFGAAVGLLNTVINLAFLVLANFTSRRITETALW